MEKMIGVMLFVVFASAVWAAGARSGDAKLDQAVEKANSDWAAAMKTGDAATIVAPYAEDGIFVAIDGSCIRGRAEIEKMYRERFERNGFAVSTKIEPRSLTMDGELAFELGYAEVGIKKDGTTRVNGGRYFTVWQRISGDWKIIRNLVLP
jgi:uncharacterized protein (TIGR02246 family)